MHIVIIGGGASGFMAAITAADHFPEAHITIIEKNKTVLNKVRVSGGGRCNVTHSPADLKSFPKQYPRGEKFLRKLFSQFDAKDTVKWFERHGVSLKTEEDGRMFPVTDSSQTITECLTRMARSRGINIRTSTAVISFQYSRLDGDSLFEISTLDGERLIANRLLIAAGGHPKASGFDWITGHGHTIAEPIPSLFTFNSPDNPLLELAGVSVKNCEVKIIGSKLAYKGPLLITHWGFSGPAVLKLSAWGARYLSDLGYRFVCKINWLPEHQEQTLRDAFITEKKIAPKQQIASHAKWGIPSRLWKAFCQEAEISDTLRWGDVSNKAMNRLVEMLTNSQYDISGKTTFKEEFVTCGGINLNEVNPTTLESLLLPGLFFSGEVLNIDGITGGFNFQNAWTTGNIAGKNIGAPPTSTLS
ncbi:BaiN/RdsA family NAD(P)/FAD-dependent oxidoreductase [Dyadobacter tibetensis]|uniref:NAD(P)/FAD-dependent oxidoreductase n=1 Tax=Dyadobacter tibetensis TaxID=1211851 RepID=UPI0004713A0D|nr:NAD(P)/FAD-dependent oxidoreductase [Dyadobacter tibetensis]